MTMNHKNEHNKVEVQFNEIKKNSIWHMWGKKRGEHQNLTTITNVKTYNKNTLKFYRFKLITFDEINTILHGTLFEYGNIKYDRG